LRSGFKISLGLVARGMSALCLGLASAEGETQRQRNVFLDVESPGALYHELKRVALSFLKDDNA
jgi:hypothetical protein